MNLKIVIPVMLAAIMVPIGAAVYSNWTNLQPYFVSNADGSPGELYFFSDRRG